jgi:hypothetical protein
MTIRPTSATTPPVDGAVGQFHVDGVALGHQVLAVGVEQHQDLTVGARGGDDGDAGTDRGPDRDRGGADAYRTVGVPDAPQGDDAVGLHAEALLPRFDGVGRHGGELLVDRQVAVLVEPEHRQVLLELPDVGAVVRPVGQGPPGGPLTVEEDHGNPVDLVERLAALDDLSCLGEGGDGPRRLRRHRARVGEAEGPVEGLSLYQVGADHGGRG